MECSLDFLAIDGFWAGPTFWGSKDDHWPEWSGSEPLGPGGLLDVFDLGEDRFKR
jgi:hypothetical protein